MRDQRLHDLLLFALASVALILAALHFAGGSGPESPRKGGTRALAAEAADRPPRLLLRAPAGAQSREAALRRDAPRFLSAFLRYEVGEGRPALEALLRRTSSPRFAARLLARPPRPPSSGAPPDPARLHRLHVAFLRGATARALVTGSARRGDALEELSFVFERHRGRWLAVGAGE